MVPLAQNVGLVGTSGHFAALQRRLPSRTKKVRAAFGMLGLCFHVMLPCSLLGTCFVLELSFEWCEPTDHLHVARLLSVVFGVE